MDTNVLNKNPFLILKQPGLMEIADFYTAIRQLSALGYFPLFYFGTSGGELLCGMAKPELPLELLRTAFPDNRQYPSLSTDIPAFHIFERELYEEHGIEAVGHPWLKPLRYPAGAKAQMDDYPFFSSESSALHEVGVGPVHAGVIEPGHFRIICHGETVEHLEIQLGYQHRGVCKLLADGDIRTKMQLAEAIAGDTAIGHGLAYCMAVEALCGVQVSPAIQTVRSIALELERIGMHLADLSALAGDIAYLSGQNFFAALRTTVINSSLAICGSRFGKRWLKPGGVNYGISAEQNKVLRNTLKIAEEQIDNCTKALFADAGVLNRFDSTGSLSLKMVQELNMSGITAKACGYAVDARKDFPIREYADFQPLIQNSGDVYARAKLRNVEIKQSLEMIYFMLSTLPDTKAEDSTVLSAPGADIMAVSVVEGWRGRIVHVIKTAADGSTEQYKVYDPSLHNWFGLALAVRNEGISDFPLCNKSFDLSYCGADL
ncbi:MAG: hydrogenase [Candidatus Cloacimonetes bacterium HGW-Cloacimonetes-3]|jgi:Ni,Fe-hydrogenase III large subunit|nr:MAG: hydrogenase [Candidatus Cloacimonetes bacterium HGW-Cloacimonetes-3]